MPTIVLFLTFLMALLLAVPAACTAQESPKEATNFTRDANKAVKSELPFADRQDYEDAQRGFLGAWEGDIVGAQGNTVWSLKAYDFLKDNEAPATVNPSLWRNAQLNMNSGLFKVADRIYQARGMDLSNMTIVEGDTGLIVIDPLVSAETAKASLDLYYKHRPRKPVVAVIYTHSHIDHYGGVKGVVNEADVLAGKVKILAPDGFMEAAISENVYAGNAMQRRSVYMYGARLPRNAAGQVDAGLGKNTSIGSVTLIKPTDLIKTTGETRVLDGVKIHFLMAPQTEAPAEMLFYFPQFRALCAAEDLTHTHHNLYTLRGAEVRNAEAWWKAIQNVIDTYGDKTDVVFASHHWPKWGQQNILAYMKLQRDLYKYMLDQCLQLMNQGYTMDEVAEKMRLPQSLARFWANRGYYGTVSHNSKAIYQKYLGFYDSNPSSLHRLPPTPAAVRYVEYMGGAKSVLDRARQDFAKGDYRWVAQVLSHVVYADPTNKEAKHLLADTLEQLGYQAESGPWRNEYLMGAYELRNGVPPPTGVSSSPPDVLKAIPLDMSFDYMGIRLDATKAEGKHIVVNWTFTDTGQKAALNLENSALTYLMDRHASSPDAAITMTRATLDDVSAGKLEFGAAIKTGQIKITGNAQKVLELLGMMVTFKPGFPIVTPRP